MSWQPCSHAVGPVPHFLPAKRLLLTASAAEYLQVCPRIHKWSFGRGELRERTGSCQSNCCPPRLWPAPSALHATPRLACAPICPRPAAPLQCVTCQSLFGANCATCSPGSCVTCTTDNYFLKPDGSGVSTAYGGWLQSLHGEPAFCPELVPGPGTRRST